MTKLKAAVFLAGMLTTSLCPAPSSALTMDNWAPAKWMSSHSNNDGWDKRKPAVATDGNGTAIGLWISPGGVNLSRSTNNGVSWTKIYVPDVLNPVDVREVHAVHSGGNHWVAVWSVINHSTLETEFHMGRSSDNGLTWTPPVGIATGPYEVEFDMDADKAGNIALIIATAGPVDPDNPNYLNYNSESNSDILHSADHGATWTLTATPLQANTPDSRILNYSQRISINNNGVWLAGISYDDWYFPPVTNIVQTAVSHDKGATWQVNTLRNAAASTPEDTHYLEDLSIVDQTATALVRTSLKYTRFEPVEYTIYSSTDTGNNWSSSQTLQLRSSDVSPELQTSENFSGIKYRDAYLTENEATGELLCFIEEDRFYSDRPVPVKGYSVLASFEDRSHWTPIRNLLPDTKLDKSNFACAHTTGSQYLLLTESTVEPELPNAYINQIEAQTLTWNETDHTYQSHGLLSNLPLENPNIVNEDIAIEMGDNGTAIAVYNSGRNWTWGAIRVQRSGNYGRNWEPAKVVQPSFAPKRQDKIDRLADVKYHGQQRWTITWMQADTQEYKWISTSQDDGRNWSTPTLLPYIAIGSNGTGEMLGAYMGRNNNSIVARSTDAGLTWTDVELTDTRSAFIARHIIHSEGPNWLAVTIYGKYLVSDDNGITWVNITPVQNINLNIISRVVTNHKGVIMAHWGWGDQVVIQRSLDHGYTWHMTRADEPAGSRASKRLLSVAWVEDSRWIAIWCDEEFQTTHQTLRWSESLNDGTTWGSEVELNSDVAPFTINQDAPAIAISGEHAVVGWVTRLSHLDADLGYTYNNYTGAPTAATDWTLYE